MPKPYVPHVQSNSSETLARRALSIDWFSAMGKPVSSEPQIEWVMNWNDALRSLVGQEWDDYLLDARNEMSGPIPRPQFDDWNWAVDQANAIIEPAVPVILRPLLPAHCKLADEAVQRILLMIRLSCVEAHFQQWIAEPFFGKLFEWLEAGHLPCGAAGEYPCRPIKVF